MNSTRRVAVSAGYTAGHINMALAVAQELTRQLPNVEVVFFGADDTLTRALSSKAGIELEVIPSAPFKRVGMLAKLHACTQLLGGVRIGRRQLRRRRIELVVGFGSYAALGTVLAARSLSIPSAIHEANATPGLTNRICARVADRIFVGCEPARLEFPQERTELTGNPVSAPLAELFEDGPTAPRAGTVSMAIVGGTLGSAFLNTHAPLVCSRLAQMGWQVSVTHQSGDADVETVRSAYRDAKLKADVQPFYEDMPSVYRRSHIALATAGASTLAELALAGLPNILVPMHDAANDHQTSNAQLLARATGSVCVTQTTWRKEAVCAHILSFIENSKSWDTASSSLKMNANPTAAARIASGCRQLLNTCAEV